ncbi:hypothetical protein [Gloeothece verrucosa]|uniref:Uncharacterized protein n=1 Tax=Gloeothece verrucosa (strain PCC 7822) TaxID=497965 RepID=E0UH46_GLOV7|nr:hypothetical protein [Gloeothece verrucosa]ADN15645.1 conserved hypothetical protein [Gloeothece verrucosa PCC 7822]
MSPEKSDRLIDFSHASEKPTSLDVNSSSEASEPLPDDHLPKNKEDESEGEGVPKSLVDDQITIANIHAG